MITDVLEVARSLVETLLPTIRVLVVGDIMLDRYITGEVERISPEAPVPVLTLVRRTQAPGGAGNVAMNLAGLGVRTIIAGFWGMDSERQDLETLLAAAGVDCSGVISSTLPTTSKTRVVARQQQLVRLDVEQCGHSLADQKLLLGSALRFVDAVDAIVISDYAKGAVDYVVCKELIEIANKRGIPVLVDPKGKDFAKYTGATTICPNLAELSGVTGLPVSKSDALLDAADQLVAKTRVKFLTVTMGDRGICLVRPGSKFYLPAEATEVFDISGAGDTVIATLAACIASGIDPESAAYLANLAAGVVVGKAGTTPISSAELLAKVQSRCIRNNDESLDQKCVTLSVLVEIIARWREDGCTIVFTNGCFDLLHVGHLRLLQQCKRLGHKVIVGLNSDSSVERLKGRGRPVIAQQDRACMLAALSEVDAVIIFEQDTPGDLIAAVRPDVLVKGGDYEETAIVGAMEVTARGGRVERFPTVKNVSTSIIIQRICERRLYVGEGTQGPTALPCTTRPFGAVSKT